MDVTRGGPEGASHAVSAIDPAVLARRWWIMVVLCTSLMIIIVGNTSLNVALPTLARELDASATQLQWMVDAYGLIFAGLLFTAGTLGDRFGRKGALQIGLLIFMAGSLLAAFQGSAEGVITGRAVMGIGAAFVMPSTLSILANVFPPHERVRAIAIWAGIAGGGAAIGPIASGFLLQHFSWGSVFLVNIPIIIGALVAGKILLPTSRDPEQARLDVIGAALSFAGIVALVYAIIEAPGNGWASTETIVLFSLAAILLTAFIAWERRAKDPMLNLHLFRDRRFSVAAGAITLVFFTMFGVFFLITQYFQGVLGYSAWTAGLSQGPIALMIMFVAPQTPKLANRFGNNVVVAAGLGCVSVALIYLSRWGVDAHYWQLLPGMLVLASGMGLTMSPLTGSIMSAVPLGQAGVGSAMNDTTRELGGALGVAVLGSLMASRFSTSIATSLSGLPAQVQAQASSGLAGALKAAGTLGKPDLAAAARQAYVDGMHFAMLVGATVTIAAAVIVRRLLPRVSMSQVESSHSIGQPASPAN